MPVLNGCWLTIGSRGAVPASLQRLTASGARRKRRPALLPTSSVAKGARGTVARRRQEPHGPWRRANACPRAWRRLSGRLATDLSCPKASTRRSGGGQLGRWRVRGPRHRLRLCSSISPVACRFRRSRRAPAPVSSRPAPSRSRTIASIRTRRSVVLRSSRRSRLRGAPTIIVEDTFRPRRSCRRTFRSLATIAVPNRVPTSLRRTEDFVFIVSVGTSCHASRVAQTTKCCARPVDNVENVHSLAPCNPADTAAFSPAPSRQRSPP